MKPGHYPISARISPRNQVAISALNETTAGGIKCRIYANEVEDLDTAEVVEGEAREQAIFARHRVAIETIGETIKEL